MKKIISAIAFLGLMAWAGTVMATQIPFQVKGSNLNVVWDSGWGIVDYEGYSSEVMLLDCGDSFDFTFGKIKFPLAWGTGEAELTVNFSQPNPNGTVSDTGQFSVFSIIIASGGELNFGGPETFAYSYMGAPGGMMELALDSLKGVQCGSWVEITGTITNLVCPVPEPGTFLLLGSGLAGLAFLGYRRKA